MGPFVAVPLAILDAPAWRAMDFIAQALWIALRRKLRNDRLNNGKIWLSCRDAAKVLGVNKDTITHRYAELEHYGFLRQTAGGFLGCDGHGIATRFCFTDLAHGTHPPTRDYEKWDGSLFEYTPRKPGRKKQNPVRSRRTPRPVPSDIRRASNGGSVCPVPSDRSQTTYLDCHSPTQGMRGYRVAQQ
jgi:DNA-binding transcriptional MocR family regulator